MMLPHAALFRRNRQVGSRRGHSEGDKAGRMPPILLGAGQHAGEC